MMLIIDAKKSHLRYWKELFDFRELILFLTWRNFLVRYKQTAVGISWTLLRPLLVMGILTFVFGKLAHLEAFEVTPYPLLVLSGVLPWQFFSNTVSECSESIIANSNLVSKIYFPRLIIPLSASFVMIFDFLVTLTFTFFVLLWYQIPLTWHLFFLPFASFLCWAFSFGLGLFVSAFNVKWRDFRYIIPFVLQFGLYITPVGFSSHLISGNLKTLFALNPLVGIIDLFRFSLLGNSQLLDPYALTVSIFISLATLFGGMYYFKSVERTFADII